MQLAEIIKQIKNQKAWNQRQVADALGTNQQTVSQMENGGPVMEKHFASFLKLLPICEELGIDLRPRTYEAETFDEQADYVEQSLRAATMSPDSRAKGEKLIDSTIDKRLAEMSRGTTRSEAIAEDLGAYGKNKPRAVRPAKKGNRGRR